jgi:hypothetical protein
MRSISSALGALLAIFCAVSCHAQPLEFTPDRLSHSDGSRATFAETDTPHGPGIELSFNLVEGGWANLSAPLRDPSDKRPITFLFNVT